MNSDPKCSRLAIIAIGHSVRALIAAIREIPDLRCLAVDFYGDADTREMATDGWIQLALDQASRLTSQTFASIASFVTKIQRDDCEVVMLLAGGMENHPNAFDQLSSIGRLLSPEPSMMRSLRDRYIWRDAAQFSGLKFPEIRESDDTEIDNLGNDWLWKPISGAGGWKINRASGVALTRAPDGYWQQFIEGRSIGVTCILGETGTNILGATESLSNRHWPGPSEFIYRGSAGPIPLRQAMHSQIIRLCEYLRQLFQVRGWLQFDFIQDVYDSLWLVECNPRWTAGMEILVDAGTNPVAEHLLAWGYRVASPGTIPTGKLTAKAIVYATENLSVDQGSFASENLDSATVADIPYGLQRIENGSPIATLKTWSLINDLEPHDHQLQMLYARLNEKRIALIGHLVNAN